MCWQYFASRIADRRHPKNALLFSGGQPFLMAVAAEWGRGGGAQRTPVLTLQSAVPFFGIEKPDISTPSNSSSLTFVLIPAENPVKLPFEPTTR